MTQPEQQPPSRLKGASPISGVPPPERHRFKPGQSGNPGGRPKGASITAALRSILKRDHNGKLLAEILAERLVKEALSGKLGHIKEVLDRTDGKVPDKAEISGREGEPVRVQHTSGIPPELAADPLASSLIEQVTMRAAELAVERRRAAERRRNGGPPEPGR